MGKLVLVRHGQSLWNAENRFTGWVDVDLSQKGRDEAKNSAKLIKELDISFEKYFTSFLKRSIKTLEIILEILGEKHNYIKAWELNERHYGSLTGLNKKETEQKIGKEQFLKYRRSWDNPPPPLELKSRYSSHKDPLFSELEKIPQTESLKDTYNRLVPFYHSNIESDLIQNKNILISAHGNSIRALSKKIFNISDEKINLLEIPTGNPLLIIFDNSGKFKDAKYLDNDRKAKIISDQ